jgi:hypothetical protein
MQKYTYEAFKDIIKVEIMLLQLCLDITRERSGKCFKNRTFMEA